MSLPPDPYVQTLRMRLRASRRRPRRLVCLSTSNARAASRAAASGLRRRTGRGSYWGVSLSD